jgi:radical SAM superfamily enzyme YgiQ (UPF0313 family)
MKVMVISGSTARRPDPVYPLGASIIGTAARRAGFEVTWFDALRHENPLHALSEEIKSVDPLVFLISIRNIDSNAFPQHEHFFEDNLKIVDLCRELSSAKIVIGGSGFSIMPEAFMNYLKVDIGVVGEGESAIESILKNLEKGEPCEEIIQAQRSVGTFACPDRFLFDADWYYAQGGVANVQTKRGCELGCVYCTYPLLEGRAVRAAEPGAVADEMESMTRGGIRDFFFVDAVFNRPEAHAAALCEEIVRRGLDVSFTGYFTPISKLPELPALLKRAGCNAIEWGTDSLSDPVLDSIGKGFGVDDVMDCSEKISRQGIPQCHNLILGGPGETEKTMEESIANLDKIDPTAVIVTIGLRVYPGTLLELMAAKKGAGDFVSKGKLESVFYIEPEVADKVVEKAARWVDERRGWICPGLNRRCNVRYLERQRSVRKRKGVLWRLF